MRLCKVSCVFYKTEWDREFLMQTQRWQYAEFDILQCPHAPACCSLNVSCEFGEDRVVESERFPCVGGLFL